MIPYMKMKEIGPRETALVTRTFAPNQIRQCCGSAIVNVPLTWKWKLMITCKS